MGFECCHWVRTTNIGLLYPKVRNNNGGDIPIDVPANQNIGGDVSPASPAALTPVGTRQYNFQPPTPVFEKTCATTQKNVKSHVF